LRDAVACRAAVDRHDGGPRLRAAGGGGERDGVAAPRAPGRERLPLRAGRRRRPRRLPAPDPDGRAGRAGASATRGAAHGRVARHPAHARHLRGALPRRRGRRPGHRGGVRAVSADPTSLRTLQPFAWRRAVGLGIVAVLVLSVVLQEPVSALLPEGTPRWLLFLAIALPIAGALVLGLSWAYPRVLLAADGTLRVRGRVVPLGEVVGLRRSVSSGPSAGYLVYTFATSDGRTIRVLVAGAPIRGLDLEQLGVLREAVAASGIRSAANAAEVERAIIGQNLLADGRRAEVDRERALRELDGLRGVAHREDPVPASRAESEAAAVVAAESDAARADDWALQVADDAREAARMVDAASGGTRMLRRVALVAFVLTCLAGVGVLITLVVREASGAWVGDVSSDALVTTFVIVLALALVTGIVWGVAADVDDAQ